MYLDRILYPVTALGPGKRIAIWVSGCERHCNHCANPELWKQYPYQYKNVHVIASYIKAIISKNIDGITITGGEPFEQAEELAELIECLSDKTEILIFSGYTYEELKENPKAKRLLQLTDVLIDGAYIDEWNDNVSALKGSVNQNIHYLNQSVQKKYKEYLSEGRKIQNFIYDYQTISVGIHNRK